MELKQIATDQAAAAIGPYSQAIAAGNMLFTSGQIPLTVDGQMVEGGITEQTHQVFRNLQAVLNAAGCTFNNVIKATVFIANMEHFPVLNEIYGSYFGEHKPARSTIEVARLPKDALVEIELIASIPPQI